MTIAFNETALREHLEHIAESERDDIEDQSFIPKMVWYQGDLPRLILFPEITDYPSRMKLDATVRMLSPIVRADQLVFVMDSYGSSQPTRSDGSRWGTGAMQYAFENKTVDAQFVHEMLTFTIASKEGWCAMGSLPYERGEDGKITFDWDKATLLAEDPNESDRASAGGFFPDMMREAMAADPPEAINMIFSLGDSMGLTEKQRDMHALCGIVKVVGQRTGVKMAIAAADEEELEILKESFKDCQTELLTPGADED